MVGTHLEGKLKSDKERKVDSLQDALLIQGVLYLFQLHHLGAGEVWRGGGMRGPSSPRLVSVRVCGLWSPSWGAEDTIRRLRLPVPTWQEHESPGFSAQRDQSCDGGSSGLVDAQMRRKVKSGAGVVREGFLEEGAAALTTEE